MFFDAAIAKLSVEQWVDGTAIYYWMNHRDFGLPSHLFFLSFLFENHITLPLFTYLSIIVESMLALGLFATRPIKKSLLLLGLLFHLFIALTFGLISFFFSMAAALVVYLRPWDDDFKLMTFWFDKILLVLKSRFAKFSIISTLFFICLSSSLALSQNNSTPTEYHLEIFNDIDSITLAGSLVVPDSTGHFPLVILISGSGNQDRYSTVLGKRPFKVIMRHLIDNGFACISLDDRGTGGTGGSPLVVDYSAELNDTRMIIDSLETIGSKYGCSFSSLGLLGHSLGGIYVMELGKLENIDYSVILSSPFEKGYETMLKQKEFIESYDLDSSSVQESNSNMRRVYEKLFNNQNSPHLDSILKYELLDTYYSSNKKQDYSEDRIIDYVNGMISTITETALFNILIFDPVGSKYRFTNPTLFIYGGNDFQVPPQQSIENLDKYIQDNDSAVSVSYILFGGLNHLLQESPKTSPLDYALADEDINAAVLQAISFWLLEQEKKRSGQVID